MTISLCMIVLNEEDVLARCLDSAEGIADEIVIVDTGSTDKTKEIAARYTQKIYDFTWIYDFSAARNFSFAQATMDYVMWLDADDIILQEDREKLIALKNSLDGHVDMIMLKYQAGFDSQGNPTLSYYRERLVKNGKGYRWQDPIHEVIPPSGNIQRHDIAITHKKEKPAPSGRNLRIYQQMIAKGLPLNPRQQFYYARELYYNGHYEEAIAAFRSFLAHPDGWLENKINGCQDLAKCYYALNRPGEALKALLESLAYDTPRAEICCDIGKHFLDNGEYPIAAFWYETARTQEPDLEKGGFYNLDCYSFTPNIQLCVCYYHMGQPDKAVQCNRLAGMVKPDHPSYLFNLDFFGQNLALK